MDLCSKIIRQKLRLLSADFIIRMHSTVQTMHTQTPTHAHTQADPAVYACHAYTHNHTFTYTQPHTQIDTQTPTTYTQMPTCTQVHFLITTQAATHANTPAYFILTWCYSYRAAIT